MKGCFYHIKGVQDPNLPPLPTGPNFITLGSGEIIILLLLVHIFAVHQFEGVVRKRAENK